MKTYKKNTNLKSIISLANYAQNHGFEVASFNQGEPSYIIHAKKQLTVNSVTPREWIICQRLAELEYQLIMTDSEAEKEIFQNAFLGKGEIPEKFTPKTDKVSWKREVKLVAETSNYGNMERLATSRKIEILQQLTTIADEFLAENFGLERTIPININSRLTKTYGNFHSYRNRIEPVKIDLSEKYIALSEHDPNGFENVVDVLKHELVHYALYMKNMNFSDGQGDFERTIAALNISSSGRTNPKNIFTKRPNIHYSYHYQGEKALVFQNILKLA